MPSATAIPQPLPGITFTAPAPALDDVLPRMDVAGFVGFAETGPVDVPVAITDPARFAEVFGAPVELLRDAADGQRVYGYLADAVAAFFANGGQRCWVVRVTAREPLPPFATAAGRAAFTFDSLTTPDAAGVLRPVTLPARSAGSWAEQVTATAGVLRVPILATDIATSQAPGPGASVTVTFRLLGGSVAPYDLVELEQGQGRLVFAVETVAGSVVQGSRGFWTQAQAPGAPRTCPGYVLTLELRAAGRAGPPSVVSGLGCVPGHDRYVGELPTDEELARLLLVQAPQQVRLTPVQYEALTTGFPLAGPRSAGGAGPVVYPAPAAPADPEPVSPQPDPRSRLARDGLPSFAPGLFLDPRLAGVGLRALADTAEQIRDVGEQPLVGLHALLAIDEVTMLAIPDAVHRPWVAPQPVTPPGPPAHETYRRSRECGHDNPAELHDIDLPALPPPDQVQATPGSAGTITLRWSGPPGAVFVAQESTRPWTWAGAAEVYRGDLPAADLYGRGPGRYVYRLRAETAAAASDWSAATVVDVPGAERWTTAAPDSHALATVHAGMTTACAARGDILAVLAAPQEFEPADAGALADTVRGQAGQDDRLLSFAALYHPWTVTAAGALIPPDGAAAGMLAAVALGPGCWREPANVPLACTVALAPEPGPGAAQASLNAGTNLVLEQPHGFVTLAAATLSQDPDLRRISVRRLLALLRRAALRYGPAFVFEPDDAVLRRHVRRQFEAILALLLARGAFAGPGQQESYQVAVSSPGESQLLAEVKVAPASALRFLTIRLVSAGAGFSVTEGA